jgi:predicted HTH transcriptional regulator
MPNGTDLQFYILHGKEERYLEFKRSMTWTNGLTKVKIAKAMMAMSNLNDGGVIVVGMRETGGMWVPEPMTPEQVASFTHDHVADYINAHATPSIQFSIDVITLNGHQFIIILVQGFGSFPVICKLPDKAGDETLDTGVIYYRSHRKIQSAAISSDEDSRELFSMVIEKGFSRHVERFHRLGLVTVEPPKRTDFSQYEKERAGL